MTQAVLLLAGAGSRLRPLTDTTPKPLIDVAGRPLLSRSIDSLVACGISELVVVTGYLEEEIRRFFREEYPLMNVELIHNRSWDTTNNAFSLLLARDALARNGMLLLDGDILYEHPIMTRVMACEEENVLAVRSSGTLGEEEMKVRVDGSGAIARIGKDLPPQTCSGESIGIARFDPETVSLLFRVLEHRIDGCGAGGEFYEASFQEMIDLGTRIGMVETGECACIEIDTHEDLALAAQVVAPAVDRGLKSAVVGTGAPVT